MTSVTISQTIVNESFGLKRLLALTEEYIQVKIASAVDFAVGASKHTDGFDKNSLRTDQCYTISLLYGLVRKDAALCSILGMSSEFFEPLAVGQIFPWLRDSFRFSKEELMSALEYAVTLKKQQVSLPESAFKAILQLAKNADVITPGSEDQEVMDLFDLLGADSFSVNIEAQRALENAVIANSPTAIRDAIKGGGDPNYILDIGMSSLHLAVTKKCQEAVSTLVDSGARVDAENREGETPLCLAVRSRNLAMVKLLLSKRAKVNYLNASGQTAVLIAAREGLVEIVEALIDGGADIRVADYDGNTAIHWAAAGGREDMVRLLFSKGASVNTVSKSGWTPLHAASEYNHKSVVSFLIDCGADIHAPGEGGFVPVHMAADKGHVDIVRLLVTRGADPLTKSNYGSTPADMAKESGYDNVVEYLRTLNLN